MPIPKKYLADLREEGTYHIYNRTNNRELLFRSDENRRFFLNKYEQYLTPFLDTFSWCLIPNHFHFLARVKTEEQIKKYLGSHPFHDLKTVEKQYLRGEYVAERLLETECQRFFTSYSMSINKMYTRNGNLFHRPFKRVEIINDHQFTQAVIYIHANALKHQLVNDFTVYPWSSWHTLLSPSPGFLLQSELFDWFGDRDAFIKTHFELSQYYYQSDVGIED